MVFAVAIGAAAALVVVAVLHQDGTLDKVTTRIQPLQAANLDAREDFAMSQSGLFGYLLTGQARFLDTYRVSRADMTESLTQVRRLAPGDLAGAAETQARAAGAWYNVVDRSANLARENRAAISLTEMDAPAAAAFYTANQQVQQRAGAWFRQVTRDSRRSLEASLALSGGFLAVAVALALAAPGITMRNIALPLRALTVTLRQLAAGDHAARARMNGAAEVQEAARSVNALADASDRLRREEQEHARLRAMARDVFIRPPRIRLDQIRSATRRFSACPGRRSNGAPICAAPAWWSMTWAPGQPAMILRRPSLRPWYARPCSSWASGRASAARD